MELVTGATRLIGAHLLCKLATRSGSKVCGLFRTKKNRQKVKQYFLKLDRNKTKNYHKIIWQ